MKKKKDQISGKEIILLQKKLKKDGLSLNDALIFIFKEMIDKKSSQVQMQMGNEHGEEIELTVTLSGDMITQNEKKEIEKHKEDEKYSVPMVS